ncbi:MAG TPA: hypothetical protein VFF04_06390 [Candidatus Babeliales bacterium]|nr:hypothetical protein [Candidatus Babeliales bacterium]
MNKSLILTLLVTVNALSLSAAQEQEQSWKKYMPTKKQVFIGACTIAAAGVALWYMRCAKKVNNDKLFSMDRPSHTIAPKQSTTIYEIDLKSSIGEVTKTKTSTTTISPGIENITIYRGSTHFACQAVDDQRLILDQFCFDTVSKKIITAAHECNKAHELGDHFPRNDKQITFTLDNGTTVTFLDRWRLKIQNKE